MTLPSLPTTDVWIAFNPSNILTAYAQALPASGASNSYWTNVSAYLRDFTTQSGKQHYLDRPEAATLKMTVNGRDGFFFNGSTNGTGYVLQPRQPIVVQSTFGGTTYPIFYGLIDQITEKVTDQLNVDLDINASDMTKYLSLRQLSAANFWPTYAKSTNATNWYRFSTPTQATVVAACNLAANTSGISMTTSQILYTVPGNQFSAGQTVTVSGLSGINTNTTFNYANMTIASVSGEYVLCNEPSGVTIPTTATISGTSGTMYVSTIKDSIGSVTGQYGGFVSFPTSGAQIYDTDNCVDLGGGSSTTGAGYATLGTHSGFGGIDFWVLGAGLSGSQILQVTGTQTLTYTVTLSVDTASGRLAAQSTATGYHNTVYSNHPISDGYWHHIGLVVVSNSIYLYCDGAFTATGAGATTGLTQSGGSALVLELMPAYVDECVISSTSVTEAEVLMRWGAGYLLQMGYPNVYNQNIYSCDRIAELLVLAGYGQIDPTTYKANPNYSATIFLVADSYGSTSSYVKGTSTSFLQVQALYWDTPVTKSTALDIIYQITDTDIGVFMQQPNGQFVFYDQNYYGSWSWNASTNTGTWTVDTFTPNVLCDDNTSGGYPYVAESLQVIRDDADLWTSVRITPQAGVDQIYENVSNEARWGYTVLTKSSTLHPTNNSALSTANFLGHLFATPLPRVQSVVLQSETVVGGVQGYNLPAMLSVNPTDVVQFKRTSPNASTSGTYPTVKGQISANMVIESISHDFQSEPGTWHTTFVLDPYPVRS